MIEVQRAALELANAIKNPKAVEDLPEGWIQERAQYVIDLIEETVTPAPQPVAELAKDAALAEAEFYAHKAKTEQELEKIVGGSLVEADPDDVLAAIEQVTRGEAAG